MKLHPLINKESTHYDIGKISAIEELENRLTVVEMIGFCKANILKYKYRLGFKGSTQSDLKKIGTYENYLTLLESLSDSGYYYDEVSLALGKAMLQFRYR